MNYHLVSLDQPLTDNELRILKIVLAEHLDKLNKNGLNFDFAISGEMEITKKMVVDGLDLIGQTHISKILDNEQGKVQYLMLGGGILGYIYT